MKQVLLAINGDIPTYKVFNYAVGLCKRISAELNILQFVKKKRLALYLSSTKKKVRQMGKILEDSFAGVAFAEEGMFYEADEILSGVSAPLKELLSDDQMDVSFKVAFSDGDPETELSKYIERHQDIILTIFDPSKDEAGQPGQSSVKVDKIKKTHGVPLFVVKS